MKFFALGCMLTALVFAASGCGGASGTKTGADALPKTLRTYIHTLTTHSRNGTVRRVDVYGPGPHAALERAAMSDIVVDPNRKHDSYLVVLHGQFVCSGCSSPGPPVKPPHGTIEMSVWSARRGEMDFGIGGSKLPVAVSKLHHLASFPVS